MRLISGQQILADCWAAGEMSLDNELRHLLPLENIFLSDPLAISITAHQLREHVRIVDLDIGHHCASPIGVTRCEAIQSSIAESS
jgi:hypothetical protein